MRRGNRPTTPHCDEATVHMVKHTFIKMIILLGAVSLGTNVTAQTSRDGRSLQSIYLAQAGQLSQEQQNAFRRLPPAEQERIKKNFQKFQQLSPDQRQELKNRYKQWQQMPTEKQQSLKRAQERLGAMQPQTRRNLQRSLRKR